MSVAPGTRFGTYEVVELLGSGGMGEVYRARDARLRRDVALKVLPDRHRLDADSQARFEREALALAALNHPNIATVLGVEEAGGVQALVMELVDGQTLADRIDRSALQTPRSGRPPRTEGSPARRSPSAASLPEAMAIARQLVDALEAAHQRGVIHRDLKPSNIMIRQDGVVKVLDFGLAKALDGGGRPTEVGASTISATAVQTILGTPAYMSPEQARGQDVDQRADIWAFGCVLFEMLAGRRAFEGRTSSDVIAAVLDREPDFDQLPADTPFLVRRLMKRCLQKDPRRRLRDIADARIDLDEAEHAASREAPEGPPRSPRGTRWWLALASAGIAITAGLSLLAGWRWSGEVAAPPVHTTVLLPPGVTVNRGPGRLLPLALSPDGRTLVISGSDGKGDRLYKRALDQAEATPLPGTEGAIGPFFSPDGAWVGFTADRRLKRVSLQGGAAIEIAPAAAFPAGASWTRDDRIVFAGLYSPLQVVPARGGIAEELLPRGSGAGALYPDALPDGRTVLFSEEGWIHALDLVSGRRTDRVVEGAAARYSEGGHLLFLRGGVLLAASFDAGTLAVTGPVLPVADSIDVERTVGAPQLAVSREGTVAFLPAARTFVLTLVDRAGDERLLSEQLMLQNPRFSPDGKRVVVAATRNPGESPELWVHDVSGGSPPYRLTYEGGRAPVWSRDGTSVTYSYPRPDERSGIYDKAMDSDSPPRQLVDVRTFHWLVGWATPQTLVYGLMETASGDRMPVSSILAFTGTETRRVVGPGRIFGGRLSPDGRWLAYYAQDAGYFEIYVTPFPDGGARVLVGEGTDPAWSPDGSEIYYRSGSRLMAARVETSVGVRVLSRRLAFEPFLPPLYDDYDVHPDGRTLVLVRPAGELRGREIGLLLNWPAQLARLGRQ
jgi:serine/threonine protein kinase/Tol biopolymer transport system component